MGKKTDKALEQKAFDFGLFLTGAFTGALVTLILSNVVAVLNQPSDLSNARRVKEGECFTVGENKEIHKVRKLLESVTYTDVLTASGTFDHPSYVRRNTVVLAIDCP